MIPPQYCLSGYSPTKCSRLFSLRYVPPPQKKNSICQLPTIWGAAGIFQVLATHRSGINDPVQGDKTRGHESQQAWGCVKIIVCIQRCPPKITINKNYTLGTAVPPPTFLSGLWKPLHTPPKSERKLACRGHTGSLRLSALRTAIYCN